MKPPFTRSLSLPETSNFRDLGGYTGHAGRTVKWRSLFRSDHLAALQPGDLADFHALNIRYAVDFRGDAERQAQGYSLPDLEQIALPVEPQVVQRARDLLDAGETLTAAQTHHLMEDTYAAFVLHNQPQFSGFLRLLLERPAPLVFHCTAGKDRTGFAAALLLEVLGVSREDIMQDYLLTNALYRHPIQSRLLLPPDALQVLWRVHPDFLNRAYQTMQAHYGSVEDYLRHALGIGDAEREQLRSLYLN